MKKVIYLFSVMMFCVGCSGGDRNDGSSDNDELAQFFLKEKLLEDSYIEVPQIILEKSGDNRAVMMTVKSQGTMLSGTTYVLYKRDNGECVIKKVACAKECDEGGVMFPAQYQTIENAKDGYNLLGRFSFSSNEDTYEDTMKLSKQYLENDKDIVVTKQ